MNYYYTDEADSVIDTLKEHKYLIMEAFNPIGDVFGLDIYEATHLKTNQRVYITINEIYK